MNQRFYMFQCGFIFIFIIIFIISILVLQAAKEKDETLDNTALIEAMVEALEVGEGNPNSNEPGKAAPSVKHF